ncbi:MAG: uracil-DNA glycosylase [Thermofilum sp. ex4484_79]|nr:MAG: uracil-DNA glycosylase [Thermofilum sp. ex4484_79]
MGTCKWFRVCPIRKFVEEGKLDKVWVKKYCKGDFKKCIRYQLEEKGIPHPDNMLPDGRTIEGLK